MLSYLDETLKFIESEEMREHLRKCFSQSTHDWWRTCAEIVALAPAPIEKKIPVLNLIAEQTVYDPEWDYQYPLKLAKSARTALNERYDNPPGTVFWLRDWHYSDEGCYFGDAFFYDFDAAVRYIGEQQKECGDPDDPNYLSHSIDKYISGENGIMVEYCQWILNLSGEIWYFDYGNSKFEPEDWEELLDYGGNGLYLPVPFKPGDIVMADCRPFAKEKRVVILEIGDDDCCGLQCLFMRPNGKMSVGAFKHNSFLRGLDENSHISGLYRVALWTLELPEEEAPLAAISAAVKANTALGSDIWGYVVEHKTYDKDDENDVPGAVWAELKESYGL